MPETQSKQPAQAYIFYGEDDFSLRRKIDIWKREFAKKYSTEGVVVLERGENSEDAMVQMLEQALSPSLFANRKLVIARDFLPSKAAETKLGDYLINKVGAMPKDFFLILWQSSKPDRRLGAVKKIFASGATLTEFELPHGKMLNAWLKAYAKTIGLEMDEPALEELAKYLGRDFYEEKKAGGKVIERKEAFDLWQAHSELSKLASFSPTADASAVRALVRPRIPENVFALTDEIARRNKKSALEIVERLLGQPSADDKTATIKIIGLLAEQVRAMLVVKVLQREGKKADEIADSLGWSSGRVFITQKNASNQDTSKLKSMLTMLTDMDARLKSSEDNPKLLIDQFILAVCT